jgi:peroxiredoxin
MAQLRQDHQEFSKRQAQVIVVGKENASAFEAYWREHALPFIGLPDPKARVLKLYGQEVKLFKLGRMPAQVIVDKAGMARFVHYGRSMSDIPENAEILALLDQLNAEPLNVPLMDLQPVRNGHGPRPVIRSEFVEDRGDVETDRALRDE